MTTDPIGALTEIIQQHTGCYSDDRPRERCVIHGTDWPCEQLGAVVADVWAWHEADSADDQQAMDAIATYLGTSSTWSGADYLEAIANIVGTVRPHPGDSAGRYEVLFKEATGRTAPAGWVIEEDEPEQGPCPNGPDCEMSQEPTFWGGEETVCLTHEGDHS